MNLTFTQKLTQLCSLARQCRRAMDPLISLYLIGYDGDGRVVGTGLEHADSWTVRDETRDPPALERYDSAGAAAARLKTLGAETLMVCPQAMAGGVKRKLRRVLRSAR